LYSGLVADGLNPRLPFADELRGEFLLSLLFGRLPNEIESFFFFGIEFDLTGRVIEFCPEPNCFLLLAS
jgi:hypothetical protein